MKKLKPKKIKPFGENVLKSIVSDVKTQVTLQPISRGLSRSVEGFQKQKDRKLKQFYKII